LTEPTPARVDPRIRAKLAAHAAEPIGVVIRVRPSHRPSTEGLVEVGPDLWAGRVAPLEIDRLAADQSVLYIEAAGEIAPDQVDGIDP